MVSIKVWITVCISAMEECPAITGTGPESRMGSSLATCWELSSVFSLFGILCPQEADFGETNVEKR